MVDNSLVVTVDRLYFSMVDRLFGLCDRQRSIFVLEIFSLGVVFGANCCVEGNALWAISFTKCHLGCANAFLSRHVYLVKHDWFVQTISSSWLDILDN